MEMFVNWLSIEDTSAADPSHDSIDCEPTWPLIEEAIRALDGRHRTVVMLGRNDAEYMVVGGGQENRYTCGLIDQNGQEFVVVDKRKARLGNVVVPCGQPTSVAMQEVIDLSSALLAAKEYAESGQRNRLLEWTGPR